MELAIDTATSFAGVALSEEGLVLEEISWHTRHNHTVELIPAIQSLLEKRGAAIGNLKAIMAICGPGTFNGLRVGLATAKGLAFAAGIPLVTVSTLEAIALTHADCELAVRPIIGSGREDIATACFQVKDSRWQKIRDEYITTVQKMIAEIESETIFCGEIDEEKESKIKLALGHNAIFPQNTETASRVSCLCRLGWVRIQSGDFDDIATLQPLYLKRPSITVPKKRDHDAMSSARPIKENQK